MDGCSVQASLFEREEPCSGHDDKETRRSLDELFNLAGQYRTSKAYLELINFVAQFRFYSPYNAFLIHVQMAGARYVAPAHRWKNEYGRTVKATARPLVILQPMGPVMFVFDVSDTEAGPDSKPLPVDVEKPFEVLPGCIGGELERTIENCKRDGIKVQQRKEGSQSAGSIRVAQAQRASLRFPVGSRRGFVPAFISVPLRYEILINSDLSRDAQYATLVHELAHLYCGHIGTPNEKWWPDRQDLPRNSREFEAESVSFLICQRLGIDSPSAAYLSGYLKDNDPPPISLECIMKCTGLIEQMGRKLLKPRKAGREA